MNFNDIMELLKNKRYRSVLILIGYIIFFIVLASMFRNSSPVYTEPEITKTPIETYCQLANYEYIATYEINDQIFSLEGKTFRTDSYFKLDDQEFYLKDGKFYQFEEDMIKETYLEFDYYNINYLCNLLDKATLVSKNENYETDSIINKYSVLDENRKDNIYISVNIKDDNIDRVILDLSREEDKYVVEIEYKNIGQVSNFTSMFDEEKVIKGVEE